jgi:hypothetical protein
VVSVTDLYGRVLGYLDRSRYFFFQVAPSRVEAGKNTSTVITASRKRRQKGNPEVSG